MKKKVCMIVPSFSAKGGIATVVSGYKGSELEKKYNIKYIESYCDGNKVKKIFKALGAYGLFFKEVMFNRPDLVHIHSSFGGSFFRKLPFIYVASWLKIPIINHIHGSEIDNLYTYASKRKKRLVETCFDKCSYLVVLSEEWKNNLQVVNTKTPKIVIENYSTIHKDCLRMKNNSPKKILFLGFITKLKGCYDIPEIAERVIKDYDNVKFILAGSGEQDKIIKILREKNLEKYFYFPGWIKEQQKQGLLQCSDVFFLPSYTEAMPMSILEAMGYGLPIVASNVGGIPQLVQENKNGFLVNSGDKEKFAKRLLQVLENNEEAFRMGQNSIEIAETQYSKRIHLNKIVELYEKIIYRKD